MEACTQLPLQLPIPGECWAMEEAALLDALYPSHTQAPSKSKTQPAPARPNGIPCRCATCSVGWLGAGVAAVAAVGSGAGVRWHADEEDHATDRRVRMTMLQQQHLGHRRCGGSRGARFCGPDLLRAV